MNASLLLCGLSFAWALTSCGDRSVKSGVMDPFPAEFKVIKQRILLPKCGKCHSFVESHKLLLKNWVVPGAAGESELYEVIEGKSMPPYGNKLLDEEIESIKQWIDSGAKLD